MEHLTSKDNSTVKQYRKLSSSRKEREQSGLFVMEGARLCADAAQSSIAVQILLITEDAMRYPEAELLMQKAERCYTVSNDLARHISDTEHPQGIFTIAKLPQQQNALPQKGKFILLDDLQDPGNLGTILRTAEALGIDAVVLSAHCPDLYSPKVIRSTMGSAFRQNCIRVPDLAEAIQSWKNSGMQCFAATLTPAAMPLQKLPQSDFCGIVIGNEGNGVSQEVIAACSGEVYIPMQGSAESLNAAVAATLCMWELCGKYIAQ